jgi:hypothetical protein
MKKKDWYDNFVVRSWLAPLPCWQSLIACFVCLSVCLYVCSDGCVNTYMPLRPVESSGITRSRVVAQDYNTPTPLFFKSCDVERFRTFFRFRFPILIPTTPLYYNVHFFFGRSPPRFATVILVIFSN